MIPEVNDFLSNLLADSEKAAKGLSVLGLHLEDQSGVGCTTGVQGSWLAVFSSSDNEGFTRHHEVVDASPDEDVQLEESWLIIAGSGCPDQTPCWWGLGGP